MGARPGRKARAIVADQRRESAAAQSRQPRKDRLLRALNQGERGLPFKN